MRKAPDGLKKSELTAKQIRMRTIASFAFIVLLSAACWLTFSWIRNQPPQNGTPAPLRSALNVNERIFSSVFDSSKKVKEYPVSSAAYTG